MYSSDCAAANGMPHDAVTDVPTGATPMPETQVEKATGLRGWVGQLAQFGAVGVVCLLLYLHQRDNAAQSKEERAMFREELKDTRSDHRNATEQLSKGLDGVKAAVERNTSEMKQVREAIKAKSWE